MHSCLNRPHRSSKSPDGGGGGTADRGVCNICFTAPVVVDISRILDTAKFGEATCCENNRPFATSPWSSLDATSSHT